MEYLLWTKIIIELSTRQVSTYKSDIFSLKTKKLRKSPKQGLEFFDFFSRLKSGPQCSFLSTQIKVNELFSIIV